MAGGSWLHRLVRGVAGAGISPPTGGGKGVVQPQPRQDAGSAVLQEALAHAQLPPGVEAALGEFRSALQSLEGRSRFKYRAGLLESSQRALEQIRVPASLGATVVILNELFADCADVIFRGFLIGGKRPAMLLGVDGLVANDRLELSVLEPLIRWDRPDDVAAAGTNLVAWLEAAGVAIVQTELLQTIAAVVDTVLGGDTALLVDGVGQAVKLASRGWDQRAVEEPVSEPSIRGPREGFVESVRTNTMLIRRKVKTPQLKIERVVLGRSTRTIVDIIFLKGVANPGLVAEVRSRVQRIDVDGILDTAMIEELIEDEPLSIFPQVANTERPDRVAGAVLEGQVAIIADGTPFALVVPVTLWSLLHAGEDYYERFWNGIALRWLRYLFAFVSLTGPSFYIAVTTFHQEMLPTPLLLSIISAREGIPFPAIVEALMMEVFFEALREAGVRLPRQVGQAVSIVGALVIGQAAVEAGLVSAPVVIIVAATGIASFTFPRFSLGIAFRLLRFPMMILAGTAGLFGFMVGLLALVYHLCGLRSFGVPYLQPLAPIDWRDLKDVLGRAPQWLRDYRSATWEPVNPKRQAESLRPGQRGTKG